MLKDMSKTLYTAEATVTGGRMEGHGRTTDGELEVDIRIPIELGGPGGGTNPEQLLAVGFAACFESSLAIVAMRRKQEAADATVVSRVGLHPGENRSFVLSVSLDVTMPSVEDPDEAVDLVRTAHKVCPFSNATRGNVEVALTANGVDV